MEATHELSGSKSRGLASLIPLVMIKLLIGSQTHSQVPDLSLDTLITTAYKRKLKVRGRRSKRG
jgi:hypothetical protein